MPKCIAVFEELQMGIIRTRNLALRNVNKTLHKMCSCEILTESQTVSHKWEKRKSFKISEYLRKVKLGSNAVCFGYIMLRQ